MKFAFTICSLFLFLNCSKAQFFDFNIFKPRLVLEGEYLHNTNDSSLSYWNSGFNYMFPVKSKLDFKVNWGELLLSGSLKDALKQVRPKAYQIFGNIGASYQDFLLPDTYGNFQAIKGGISGIYVTVKNKKMRSLLFGTSVRVTQTPTFPENFNLSSSLFIGSAIAANLKSMWVVGAYGSYYGNRLIGSPVVMYYKKQNKHWSYMVVLPVQAKLTWRKNKKFEESFTVSYTGNNFQLRVNDPLTNTINNGTYFSTGVRISAQSKIKLGKRNHLYVEVGWQDLSQTGKIDGYGTIAPIKYAGSAFSKIRINIPLGKALLNSETFDFGL